MDARSFYRRWGIALSSLVLLTIALLSLAIHEWMNTRSVAEQINRTHQEIARLDQEKARAQAILNKPENQGTRDSAQFLNQLIARKAFSWTEVFADLEKLMPRQVHVVSIQPELNAENQIFMKMEVAGTSREKAIELVRNLEKSRHFRQPRLLDETTSQQPQQGGDTVKIDVTALYLPQSPVAGKSAASEKAAGGE